MSDDWKPGDLALCVNANWLEDSHGISFGDHLRPGAIYTVARVGLNEAERLALWLIEVPCEPEWGKRAIRFRKIKPHTPDEEDRETIRLLNSAPVKEPVA